MKREIKTRQQLIERLNNIDRKCIDECLHFHDLKTLYESKEYKLSSRDKADIKKVAAIEDDPETLKAYIDSKAVEEDLEEDFDNDFIEYKGYYIEHGFYNGLDSIEYDDYTVQYCGDDYGFSSVKDAKKFIDEISEQDDLYEDTDVEKDIKNYAKELVKSISPKLKSYVTKSYNNCVKEYGKKGAIDTLKYIYFYVYLTGDKEAFDNDDYLYSLVYDLTQNSSNNPEDLSDYLWYYIREFIREYFSKKYLNKEYTIKDLKEDINRYSDNKITGNTWQEFISNIEAQTKYDVDSAYKRRPEKWIELINKETGDIFDAEVTNYFDSSYELMLYNVTPKYESLKESQSSFDKQTIEGIEKVISDNIEGWYYDGRRPMGSPITTNELKQIAKQINDDRDYYNDAFGLDKLPNHVSYKLLLRILKDAGGYDYDDVESLDESILTNDEYDYFNVYDENGLVGEYPTYEDAKNACGDGCTINGVVQYGGDEFEETPLNEDAMLEAGLSIIPFEYYIYFDGEALSEESFEYERDNVFKDADDNLYKFLNSDLVKNKVNEKLGITIEEIEFVDYLSSSEDIQGLLNVYIAENNKVSIENLFEVLNNLVYKWNYNTTVTIQGSKRDVDDWDEWEADLNAVAELDYSE